MVLSSAALVSEVYCYFFAALPCEAKPLIEHFKLKKELSCTAFTIYRNSQITLTVTGIGKSSMAAGVAYTLALFSAPTLPVLMNVGIAGHGSYQLGSVFAADKITDQESGRSYYPQLIVNPPCPTQAFTTVVQPQLEYPSESLYEMEASAFYEIAIRFSSNELIQCIKIISDNKNNPSTQIKPAQVSRWLSDVLPLIEKYYSQLSRLASMSQTQLAHTVNYAEIITNWHFTTSEKLQLSNLLSKRSILTQHKPLDLTDISAASGKAVLKYLRAEVDKQAFGGF